MRNFIFYTIEGYTQDPQGEDIDNCQMLGVACGEDERDALQNLLNENPWIEERDYDSLFILNRELK